MDILHAVVFIDIFIQMNTIFYDKGEPVKRFSRIFKQYVRNIFIFEFIGCFNLFAVFFNFSEYAGNWAGFGQLILVFVWIAKLDRIETCIFDYLQLSETVTYIFKFVKLIGVVLIISHWMCCIWFILIQQENEVNFFSSDEYYDPLSLKNQYMAVFYWITTVMTTVGFGDLVPISTIEQICCIFFILFSTVVFAYTVNTIGEIYDERLQINNSEKIKLVELNEFLRNKKVSNNLRVS